VFVLSQATTEEHNTCDVTWVISNAYA